MSEPALTDRQRAALDVRRSLSVTAGAGSGKTTVLVERYLRVLDELGAEPREVVAITFTQKAAAEMRARLVARLASRSGADARAERLRRDIVQAPISTIHAFCGDVLREFALDARVDPSFDVLEGNEQTTLLREEIDDLLRERSADGDPGLRLLARTFGRTELARSLETLARRRDDTSRWAKALAAETDDQLVARWGTLPGALDPATLLLDGTIAGDLQRLQSSAAMPVALEDECASLARAVAAMYARARKAAAGEGAPVSRADLAGLDLLRKTDREPRGFGRVGTKRAWGKGNDDVLDATRFALARVADRVAHAMTRGAADLDRSMLPSLRALAALGGALLDRYRARKDARSLLDFDDLVSRTAALLSDATRPAPRARLRERFRALLVDEFQDVDPVQWRVIEALATGDDGKIPPERLFVVGDEKQSIYRFRGADVSIFRGVGERIDSIALDDGFRSLAELVEWQNGAFERIFSTVTAPWEARPGPLRSRRERKDGEAPGEVIHVVLPKRRRRGPPGSEGDGGEGTEGEEGAAGGGHEPAEVPEPEVVARLARREIAGGRKSSDVAILLRRRTHLKEYEEALRQAGVPFVVHGGIGFYRAPEVVDATNLLCFLADARADIELAAVLRSPYASLADGTLFLVADLRTRARSAAAAASVGAGTRGVAMAAEAPLELQAAPAPSGPATLWEALRAAVVEPSPLAGLLPADEMRALRRGAALLEGLRRDADVRPAAELLRVALEGSGARAAYGMGPRGPQALANLEKLLDTARRFEERGFRGIARLADMLDGMVEADETQGEADVGGADEGVRILTVHASKGLEYPVVIVPECGAKTAEDTPSLLFEEIEAGRPEVALPVQDPLQDWARGRSRLGEILKMRNAQKGEAEMRRLFYVACTRAKDRLILVGEDGREASWLGWARAAGVPAHRTLAPEDLEEDDAPPFALAPGGFSSAFALGGPDGAGGPGGPGSSARLTQRDPQRQLTMFFAPPTPAKPARRARAAAPPPPPPAAPPPLPPLPPPPRAGALTPSSWKLFRRSPEDFLRRATLRIPEALLHESGPDGDDDGEGWTPPGEDGRAVLGRLEGTAVHRLLELGRAPGDPGNREEIARVFAEEGIEDAAAVDAALARAEQALDRVARSPLGAEIAAAGPLARDVERAFTVALPEGVLEGRIDLVLRSALSGAGRPRVVDWKTDDTGGAAAEETARTRGYGAQLELYAFAAARILGVSEVAGTIFFTRHGTSVERVYGAADLAGIEKRLRADLRTIADMGGQA